MLQKTSLQSCLHLFKWAIVDAFGAERGSYLFKSASLQIRANSPAALTASHSERWNIHRGSTRCSLDFSEKVCGSVKTTAAESLINFSSNSSKQVMSKQKNIYTDISLTHHTERETLHLITLHFITLTIYFINLTSYLTILTFCSLILTFCPKNLTFNLIVLIVYLVNLTSVSKFCLWVNISLLSHSFDFAFYEQT